MGLNAGEFLGVAIPASVGTSTVATAGFSFWYRMRKGSFPRCLHIFTQAGFSLCGGLVVSYYWLLSKQRQREAFMRMMHSASGTYEVADAHTEVESSQSSRNLSKP